MDINDEKIASAVKNTEIIRLPRQSLATFGLTNVYYYIVTEPSYKEIEAEAVETVVREGRVIAERPRIVTPYYLNNLDGFSTEARQYFNWMMRIHGADAPGVLYAYRNEPKETNIVSADMQTVVGNLNSQLDERGDPLVSIIRGQDNLWDVSLMKFIYELTRSSLSQNLAQMGSRGLLNVDSSGVPAEARLRIEEMFELVRKGDAAPADLKREMDRWNVFAEYEDRFLALFHKSR